jgi:hypothetical protein
VLRAARVPSESRSRARVAFARHLNASYGRGANQTERGSLSFYGSLFRLLRICFASSAAKSTSAETCWII